MEFTLQIQTRRPDPCGQTGVFPRTRSGTVQWRRDSRGSRGSWPRFGVPAAVDPVNPGRTGCLPGTAFQPLSGRHVPAAIIPPAGGLKGRKSASLPQGFGPARSRSQGEGRFDPFYYLVSACRSQWSEGEGAMPFDESPR